MAGLRCRCLIALTLAYGATACGDAATVSPTRFFNRMGLWAYDPLTGALLGLRVVSRNVEGGPGPDKFRASDSEQIYDPTTLTPIGPQRASPAWVDECRNR